MRRTIVVLVVLLCSIVLVGTNGPGRVWADAQTLNVTNCADASGPGTLVDETAVANSDNAGDTIDLHCSPAVGSPLTITGSMTIDGGGSYSIEGSPGTVFRSGAIIVAAGGDLNVKSVTLSGFVNFDNSTLASVTEGGAIHVASGGMLTVTNSTFSGNRLYGGWGGGDLERGDDVHYRQQFLR